VHDYSFEDYVGSSGPKLKRLALLLTGDLTEAEALLQSVYAKVMPHWGKVSRYDVPDGFMRRVVVSILTSWWRRSRGREKLVPAIPEHGTGAAAPTTLSWRTWGCSPLSLRPQVLARHRVRHLCELPEPSAMC